MCIYSQLYISICIICEMSKKNFVSLGQHPPGRFYGPPVPPLGVRGAPAGPPVASVRGGRGRGHRGSGRCVTAGRGPHRVPGSRSRVRDDSDEETFKSYDDSDVGNTIPPFRPSRPADVHFELPLLRHTMTTAVEFFQLFFTIDMKIVLLPTQIVMLMSTFLRVLIVPMPNQMGAGKTLQPMKSSG